MRLRDFLNEVKDSQDTGDWPTTDDEGKKVKIVSTGQIGLLKMIHGSTCTVIIQGTGQIKTFSDNELIVIQGQSS